MKARASEEIKTGRNKMLQRDNAENTVTVRHCWVHTDQSTKIFILKAIPAQIFNHPPIQPPISIICQRTLEQQHGYELNPVFYSKYNNDDEPPRYETLTLGNEGRNQLESNK